MKWIFVLLLGVGLSAGFDREATKDKLTEYRLLNQNLHLDKLDEDFEHLEEEYNKIDEPVSNETLRHLLFRIRRLEDDCPKRHVSCGGDHPICLHEIKVCDGIEDCKNGRDEHEKVCDDSIVSPGSTFIGLVHWTACKVRPDHEVIISITDSKHEDFFKPRAWLRATISRDDSHLHEDDSVFTSYNAKGYFSFGARLLVLAPVNDTDAGIPIAISCRFNYGNNDHGNCKVRMAASLQVCASFKVDRREM